jgi:hypothetical protein
MSYKDISRVVLKKLILTRNIDYKHHTKIQLNLLGNYIQFILLPQIFKKQ